MMVFRNLVKFGVLVSLLLTEVASADAEMIRHLDKRLHFNSNSEIAFVQSFENRDQSYVYDQALAIIAYAHEKNQKKADALIEALKKVQLSDGSLYFSYYQNGKSPYPLEGDKRFAGALAWVALSLGHYQNAFSSKKHSDFHKKLLGYLHSQLVNVDGSLALKFNPTDIKETSWREDETAALEHNLDAYAAFRIFNELNPDSEWKETPAKIQHFVLSLWDSSQNHFWSGMNVKSGAINKEEIYLDNQTWSILALKDSDLSLISATKALKLNCEELMTEHKGIHGFFDRRPNRGPAQYEFVWSEGSLGQILAMEKLSHLNSSPFKCSGKSSEDFLVSLKKMMAQDGGIAYASADVPDFTTSSSIAGSAWFYFAKKKINPFSI